MLPNVWSCLYIDQSLVSNGPKGGPYNLPQPAWHLGGLFFWSDMSWLRADLCANSYVISMRFCLLSKLPSCTCYISYVGIERIIHNLLFRIIRNMLFVELGPTGFQVVTVRIFLFLNNMNLLPRFCLIIHFMCFFNQNKIVLSDSFSTSVLSTVCLGI